MWFNYSWEENETRENRLGKKCEVERLGPAPERRRGKLGLGAGVEEKLGTGWAKRLGGMRTSWGGN